jgi:Xaa-Pro dipeptidase
MSSALAAQLQAAGMPAEPSFEPAEYEARLAAVRARMEAAGLDTLLLTSAPNLCYLTGYETIMPTCYAVAVIPLEGEAILHLPEEDIPCALLTGWVREFEFFDWAQPLDAAGQLAELLRARGAAGGTIGVETRPVETYAYGAMDAHTYLRLAESLPDATLVDATDLVPEVRVRKSPAELEWMRRAGSLSQLGTRAAMGAIAAGATDNDIAVAAYSAMVGAGSELMSVDPIVLVGRRGAFAAPHATHKRTPLRDGDAVQVELSGAWLRYNAPLIRSGCLGEPSPELQRLADASMRTVALLLENIRAGRSGDEIARAAEPGFDDADPRTSFHGGYGYAVGLAFPPTWTEAPVYVARGIERELEPDMTLHLPIWTWIPGEFAVGFSETVRVTEDGCELLTPGEEMELVIG